MSGYPWRQEAAEPREREAAKTWSRENVKLQRHGAADTKKQQTMERGGRHV
ncbi:hypothetical protein I5Q83_27965 [Enterocloster clostridioformis]|uniref:hypothetical protein n=1 Tax=Enterocloster clostridioformis TaxID=1531 RepID=UPI0012F4F14A|nr:hypothetical protein [Enterocloster clostridioformis]QQQ99691.1 hypothetical protein I5Q83_27965 [Enterocloster clostridioformis]